MTDDASGQWSEVVLTATAEDVDIIEAWLFEAGALAVTLADPAIESSPESADHDPGRQHALDHAVVEPLPGETPLWAQMTVTGLFERNRCPAELSSALQAAAVSLALPPPAWRLQRLDDEPWERSWMRDFVPIQCAPRLWVCPLHLEPPDAQAVTIRLDPGLAFGTGTHPTTAQCLRWLGRETDQTLQPLAGQQVIDYGCGSGILAVAAARLGAATVLAVDIDEQALQATTEHARRNAVAQRIRVGQPAVAQGQSGQLVLANILYQPLLSLADTLTALVSPGGHLVMAGMLCEQAESLMECYCDNFRFEPMSSDSGWALLCGVRNDADR